MKEDPTYRDRQLFKRISQGDSEAFKEFFEAYSVKLAMYVSRFLNSDLWAEEIVQDVFLKLWTIRETISDIEAPAGFVYKMTANRAKDQLKSREHKVKLQYYMALYAANTAGNYTQEQFDFRTVERLFKEAVSQLPAKRVRIFRMRHEQGMSYDEIAQALNLSRNTVRAQLNFAMQNISDYLLQHGDISRVIALIIYSQIIFSSI